LTNQYLVRRTRWAAAVLALSLGSIPAFGQTSGVGNISGDVTDSTGAQVPNASITVINTDTGISRETRANGQGEYLVQFLQSGHYEVIITAPGFGKVDRKNLTVFVGQILSVDASLTVGGAATEVQVTSDTPILDTDKTEVSQIIDEHLISSLPVATRNWSAFVLNTPNVTPDGGSGLVSFHGISGLYNQNYVDGANNNQMLFSEARGRASGAPYVYSIDSIKEFQAETSNYSVEFGQAAGGQVNAITKSGTNSIHGDLFYYLRYPTLNALDPETKYTALFNTTNVAAKQFLLTQPVHQQQQFGGSVGGPIIKDRLFYFFTYDGFRKVGKALYYNSNTITTTPTGTTTSTNVISPTQCSPFITAAQCLSAINFVNTNAFGAPTRYQKQDLFFPRIDWHISKRNDMFVDFNRANYGSSYGYNQANTVSGGSPSQNGPTVYHERFLVAGVTTQLSDRTVNQVHFQLGRDLETAGANAPAPSVAIGTFTYGMPNALPRVSEPDEKRFQITDVVSTTRGRHTFKFGGDVNIVHEVMINLFQGGGVYAYSGSTNAANFANYTSDVFHGVAGNTDPYAGYHFTSLVQTTDILNPANQAGKDDFYMKMFDGFAEDSWKLTSRFTLNAGVRYDIQITPPPTKNNTLNALSTYYSSTIKNTNRISPRVGFAWNPHEGTVIRGGYGIFSGLNQGSTYYAMRVENGVIQVNYNYTGCASACTAATAATTGIQFPNLPFTPPGPDIAGQLRPVGAPAPIVGGSQNAGSQSFHGLDPNFVPPYAQEFNFGFEQALPGKMSLTANYVGTRGMRLPVFIDANLRGQTPHGVRSYNVIDASGAITKQITTPVYLVSDRIVPTLQGYNTGYSIANTWYNGLGVTVRRPFANGLEILMNYTWSHATDNGQVNGANGTFYGGDQPLDPNHLQNDNGNSDTDIRNRFVLSFVYQPKLMMENKWVKQIVDGFQFAGAETASGGQPIFLGMGGTVYSGGAGSYASGGNIYGGSISSSSGVASTGRPPQIGRNSIYAPGFNNFDMRVTRDIPIHDQMKLSFSANAYNLLNHRIVTGVNSTYSTYATCTAAQSSAVPTGSVLQGCITPFAGSGVNAFGNQSSTSNLLYNSRQMEFIARFTF
jgi:outer membrane receptor protein involved in Fe transport